MMDRYLAQCADEAFKALLTDEDLETRLNTAATHLGIRNDSQVDTASQDVRSALADVRSNRNDPCPNRASAIGSRDRSIYQRSPLNAGGLRRRSQQTSRKQ